MTAVVTVVFVSAGCLLYTLGTVGLLRFPDTRSRLHALTKADNLGLGLLVIGLSFAAGSPATAGLLVLIWMLALAASATAAGLLARDAGDGVQKDGAHEDGVHEDGGR